MYSINILSSKFKVARKKKKKEKIIKKGTNQKEDKMGIAFTEMLCEFTGMFCEDSQTTNPLDVSAIIITNNCDEGIRWGSCAAYRADGIEVKEAAIYACHGKGDIEHNGCVDPYDIRQCDHTFETYCERRCSSGIANGWIPCETVRVHDTRWLCRCFKPSR